MKKSELRQIIKEEISKVLKEEAGIPPSPNVNTGDLFSSLEATGKLEAPQGGASMVGQNYTLNGDSKYDKMFFNYEPNSPTPFGLKQIGGHGLDSRFLSKFGLKPTQSWTAGVDQFIFDGNYNPRWFDEKRFGEIVDHFSGGLSREAKRQRDFYKDRGQTSLPIDNVVGRSEQLCDHPTNKRASFKSHGKDFCWKCGKHIEA